MATVSPFQFRRVGHPAGDVDDFDPSATLTFIVLAIDL